jgi:hypothetical protein
VSFMSLALVKESDVSSIKSGGIITNNLGPRKLCLGYSLYYPGI